VPYEFELDGRLCDVAPVYHRGGFDLAIDGRRVQAELRSIGSDAGDAEIAVDGRRRRILLARRGDVVWVQLEGRAFPVALVDSLRRAASEIARDRGPELLRAPMPGIVVEVAVAAGAEVRDGELLVTIESMKLQTAIRAPHAGRIAEVAFGVGQGFDKGAVLVRLERAAEQESSR
jgi:biotin carboxyl carrier protein